MPYLSDSGRIRSDVGDVVAEGPRRPTPPPDQPAEVPPPVDSQAVDRYRQAVREAAASGSATAQSGDTAGPAVKPDPAILSAAGRFSRDWRDDLQRLKLRFKQVDRIRKANELQAEGERLLDEPPPPGPIVEAGMTIAALVEAIDAHRMAQVAQTFTPAEHARQMIDKAEISRVHARRVLIETGNEDVKMEIEALQVGKGGLATRYHALQRKARIIDEIATLTAAVERWGNNDLRAGESIGRLVAPATLKSSSELMADSLRAKGMLAPRPEDQRTSRDGLAGKFFAAGKERLQTLLAREPDARQAAGELPELEKQAQQINVEITQWEETLLNPANTAWNP